MSEPRKVYIATRKDSEKKKEAFHLLGDEFRLVDRADEAEFIVLDCDDPAALKEWVSSKPTFVVPDSCYPPIVLAALSGKGHQGFLEKLEETYEGDPTILPTCETPDELLRTLKRLQAALPFYNSKNAPAPDLAKVREMALSILRAG